MKQNSHKYARRTAFYVDLDDNWHTSLQIDKNPVNPSSTDLFWTREGWNGYNILFTLSADEREELIAALEAQNGEDRQV